MISDKNKNITSVAYNHLDLPVRIVFGGDLNTRVDYVYDALGAKLQKTVVQYNPVGDHSIVLTSVTDYLGFQYKDGVLQFFPTSEGYVSYTKGSYSYVYNYTDHLGNVRMCYTKNHANPSELKIIEESHYYPFGLKHQNYNSEEFLFEKKDSNLQLRAPVVKEVLPFQYKYQGQERQDELGLNWDSFKYRNYDYAIGRFMSIDPLAEDYVYNGPYNFAENRVIDGRELEGLEWASVKNKEGITFRQLTVQMYNNSSLNEKQVSKLTATMQADFAKTFSGNGSNAELVVNNVPEAKGNFLITLTDTKTNGVFDKNTGERIGATYAGGKTGEIGQTQKNSFEVTTTVDGSKRSNSDMSRSFSHEAGHTAGLEHPWKKTGQVIDIKQGADGVKNSTVRSNLMNSDQNPNLSNRSTSGTNLTTGQLKSIDETIKSQTTP